MFISFSAYYHPKDCLHPESRPGSPSKRAISSVISNFEGMQTDYMCDDFGELPFNFVISSIESVYHNFLTRGGYLQN